MDHGNHCEQVSWTWIFQYHLGEYGNMIIIHHSVTIKVLVFEREDVIVFWKRNLKGL